MFPFKGNSILFYACFWFIFKTRKRYDALIKDLEKKQDAHRETLAKLQHQFQQAQVKAAAKA